ncbi:MYND Zn-finger protein [Ceratobasidium sp. AG-Ba]|nr:MYND Zn-finger protein [Ceratobasidium sp. AG-Ba]
MSSSVSYYPCESCGQLSCRTCTRCESAWYCSSAHQQADWGRHSRECVPRSSYAPGILPSPSRLQQISHTASECTAMLLSWDSIRPRLIRVPLSGRVNTAENVTEWSVQLNEFLGANTAIATREITRNVGGEPLRYPLRMFFRDRFLTDGSPLNQTINALTHGKAQHAWSGNIIVMKWSGSRRQGYANMNLSDVNIIASWLLSYPPGWL